MLGETWVYRDSQEYYLRTEAWFCRDVVMHTKKKPQLHKIAEMQKVIYRDRIAERFF